MMARNRFEMIHKFLHFNDNAAKEDDTDRLYKIRPVIDLLLGIFMANYVPHEQISIDEGKIFAPYICKLLIEW